MGKNEELKLQNIQEIRKCFYEKDILTKNALHEETGLSLAGTTNVLAFLLKQNEIRQIEDAESTGGRKSKQYQLNPDFAHIGTVVLHRTESVFTFSASSFDLKGRKLQSLSLDSESGRKEELTEIVRQLLSEDPKISQLCISVPGECRDGYVEECDFPDFRGCDIASLIEGGSIHRIVAENDVNAAAIGVSHRYGSYKNIVYVYQPEAEFAGCGVLIGGKLYNGFSHKAGEIRYMPFLTEEEQLDLLKDRPAWLLEQIIMTMCAVLDPEAVFWCSDAVHEEISPDYRGKLPELIHTKEIRSDIERGLFEIGKHNQAGG